ncbi:MAG: cytochrome c [Pseudomonadota bacterium]|nr:cytochrome c [Pseudomonadota bacterium]
MRILALVGLTCLAAASAGAEPVDLERLLAGETLPTIDVTVTDQAYKREMRFRGHPLNDVLAAAFPDLESARGTGIELVFRAADGYSPSMSLDRALEAGGVVAFRDADRPDADPWETFLQGKTPVTPAPYYVVWPGTSPDDPRFKWPYQLVEIDLVPFGTRYGAMAPASTEAKVVDGFFTFKENCVSCHSVNLVGGDLAPELNVPKNVTEYLPDQHLRGVIRAASSYRARTKMPDFDGLSDAEIDGIVAYLDHMSGHKSCGITGKPDC